jgi:hypothetical protein
MSLDEITERLSNASPSGETHAHLMAELTRRQTIAQIEAAGATKATAEHNRRNANYMLASVIVLVLASAAQVLVTLLTGAH